MSLIAPTASWPMDFQFDRTIDGGQVKLLNIGDEYTREAIAIRVDHSITADDLVVVLDGLPAVRGAPQFLGFDYSPEFIAHAGAGWCTPLGPMFIDPGWPRQNGCVESCNGKLRDELLSPWPLDSLLEARVHRGLARGLQHQPATRRPREFDPDRVRNRMEPQAPTPTGIAPGHASRPPQLQDRALTKLTPP